MASPRNSDHYNTLGVVRNSTAADLRAAYLKLARANHPDQFEGKRRVDAEARMQEINEAWNVLGVAHKRREYDRSLPATAQGGSSTTSTSTGAPRRGRTHFRAFDDEPVTTADFDLDPTPIAGSREIPRWMSFAPVLFVGAGVAMFVVGLLFRAGEILALAAIGLGLGFVSFLVLPLIVMSRAKKDPYL